MHSRTRGFWFLTLFAAGEIPAAIVTYVSLLMFLQLGLAPAEATFLSALLFVPWLLKPLVRTRLLQARMLRLQLLFVELLLFAAMLFLAFAFRQGWVAVFAALACISILCVWHGQAADLYYERMLRPIFQKWLATPRLVCSQAAVVVTYGALIFLVGTLEVYFRQVRYSWSTGCYMAAGIFLLFLFHHLFSLHAPEDASPARRRAATGWHASAQPLRLRLHEWRSRCHPMLVLALLLLPQGLMFHARVLYLYDACARGGLQCTMQEIGFAQGTVGVIAFSFGLSLGQWLAARHDASRLFWPLSLCLVLSPFVYLGMTVSPPTALWELSCCTAMAQLLFGLGLGVCRLLPVSVSGVTHPIATSMLQAPLVCLAMILPMAVSGWFTEMLGYSTFFLVNAAAAPVALLGVYLLRR